MFCGVCGTKIENHNTNFCPKCGSQHDLKAQTISKPKFCRACGVLRDNPNAKFCSKCGASFGELVAVQQTSFLGNPDKDYEEGINLLTGRKGQQDLPNARVALLKAADSGYGPALYTLGMMNLRGMGFNKDLGRAQNYFVQAANQNVAMAKDILSALKEGKTCEEYPVLSTGRIIQKDPQVEEPVKVDTSAIKTEEKSISPASSLVSKIIPVVPEEVVPEEKTVEKTSVEPETISVSSVTSEPTTKLESKKKSEEEPKKVPKTIPKKLVKIEASSVNVNTTSKTTSQATTATQSFSGKNKMVLVIVALLILGTVAIGAFFVFSKRSDDLKPTPEELSSQRYEMSGYYDVKKGYGFMSGLDEGEYYLYYFKVDSSIGQKITSVCRPQQMCIVKGITRYIEKDPFIKTELEKQGTNASAHRIVIVESVKSMPLPKDFGYALVDDNLVVREGDLFIEEPMKENVIIQELRGEELKINNTDFVKTLSFAYEANTLYRKDSDSLDFVQKFKAPTVDIALIQENDNRNSCSKYFFVSAGDDKVANATDTFGTCNRLQRTQQNGEKIIVTMLDKTGKKVTYVYFKNKVTEVKEEIVPEKAAESVISKLTPKTMSKAKEIPKKVEIQKVEKNKEEKQKGGFLGALKNLKKSLPKGETPKQDNPWD